MQKTINISKHETTDTKVGTKHLIYDGKLKYEFFEKKKDGNPTKAFAQYKEFELGVGSTCPAEVDETKEEFTNKEGEDIKFTRRTVLYWIGDEHGVPYVSETPKVPESVSLASLDRRVKRLEDNLFGTEKVADDVNPEDLPF